MDSMEYYSTTELFNDAKSLTMQTPQSDVCRLTGKIAQTTLYQRIFGNDDCEALNQLYKLISAFHASLANQESDDVAESKLKMLTDFAEEKTKKR